VVRRAIFIVLALVCLFVLVDQPCVAQASAPCQKSTTWWFPDPVPPGWFYLGPYPAPFVYVIGANESGLLMLFNPPQVSGTCFPPDAKNETCPKCSTGGYPISLATGNTFIEQADIQLPGLGGGLSLTRTWLSMWPSSQIPSSVGIFGPNWRSTYEERVFMGSDNWLKYARGDGSYWSFGAHGKLSQS
jgi:hypothetical protein